jgi:hypothetical protein
VAAGQLFDVLNGELAVGAWLEPPSDQARRVDGIERDDIDVGVMIGLRDADAASQLLARMSDSDSLAGLLEKRDAGYQVAAPGAPQLFVRIADGALTMQSATSLFGRALPPGERGRWADEDSPHFALRAQHEALQLGVDLSVAAFVAASSVTRSEAPRTMQAVANPSPEYRAKLAELRVLEERVKLRRRAGTLGARHQLALVTRRLGSLALRLADAPWGVVLRAEHRLARGGYAGLVRAALGLLERDERRDDELGAMEGRRLELELELEEMGRELERASEPPTPSP